MEYLFSYGTLQLKPVQIETFGRELTGTPDALIGYVLTDVIITDPKVIQLSGKNVHPMLRHTGRTEDTVTGTVFAITATELAQVDAYEVDAYVRKLGSLRSGGQAWIYANANE